MVATGRDANGAIIVHEYVRCRTGDTSKRKMPTTTLFHDLRDARVTESGWLVFGKSEVLDRRPRDDEMLMMIADIKLGRSMPDLVWNQIPQVEEDASTSQAVGSSSNSTTLRNPPLADPSALPMMPPGTRLLAFVSLDHSCGRPATWIVGEMSWLFSPATFARTGSGMFSAHHPRCGRRCRS